MLFFKTALIIDEGHSGLAPKFFAYTGSFNLFLFKNKIMYNALFTLVVVLFCDVISEGNSQLRDATSIKLSLYK